MTSFDVQGIEIGAPAGAVFAYVADPARLPEWTSAFRSAGNGQAVLATPRGAVEIRLDVQASTAAGTVDWIMTFPDGSVIPSGARSDWFGARAQGPRAFYQT